MIVLKARLLLEEYEKLPFALENMQTLQELRHAFRFVDITRYRGTARTPLFPFGPVQESEIQAFRKAPGAVLKHNVAACARFCELADERPSDTEDDCDILASLQDAEEVHSLTDHPSHWEIIHVSRDKSEPVGALLGYDIGYWGGDHFSLIADTIVVPCWHPPDPHDFAALSEALQRLNEHVLFSSPAEADDFKRFYKSMAWAEAEDHDGQFCIIRVCSRCK